MSRCARIAFALAAALLAASGCMTIDTQMDAGYDGPQVYSGVRKDAGIFLPAFQQLQMGWVVLTLVDFPFSFLADTALLPATIPRDDSAKRKQAEVQDVASERPSPVRVVAGEDAVATAQRLFNACAGLLHAQDPEVADCYSIGARIELGGAAPVRGSDYKPALRAALARDTSDGVLVEWRSPTFAAEGERVRISATRASSAVAVRSPVTLVVGPCEDGGWRILEETGPGSSRE
ncbi:MAG: YceK/YidQ family lipoprotein [Myxococcota bacterium]